MENKNLLLGIIALIIGASALGIGTYSIVNFQITEGPSGPPGEDGENGIDGTDGIDGINGTDGIDGKDAPGGLVVRILNPDDGEIVFENITIRALIYGSEDYTISILLNGTEIGNSIPMVWDTSMITDGWWNISLLVIDISSSEKSIDTVIILVKNSIEFKGGIWDDLYRNTQYSPHNTNDDWLIHATNEEVNNINYLLLSNNNTRFHLIKEGWYQISITLDWDFSVSTFEIYRLSLFKNGIFIEDPVVFLNMDGSYAYQFNSVFLISSDGNDYFELNCEGGADFGIWPFERYNRLEIIYIS